MRKPHKHAEFIKAWADGAEIQARDGLRNVWVDIIGTPVWTSETYRIKPEPAPDYVVYPNDVTYRKDNGYESIVMVKDKLRLVFDGETGELKSAEVIK
jgi:hypothetical protein